MGHSVITSKALFLDVIDIEPDVDWLVSAEVLRDVAFQKDLKFHRHVANPGAAHFIVPKNQLSGFLDLGLAGDPIRDFAVGRSRGHKFTETSGRNTGKVKECTVERAIKVVFAIPARQGGPAFVQRPGGHDISGKGISRASGKTGIEVGSEKGKSFSRCHGGDAFDLGYDLGVN